MRSLLAAGVLVLLTTSGCLSSIGGGPSPGDYLRDDKFTTWTIEIDSVEGHGPSSAVLSNLRARLNEVAHKDSITTQLDDTIAGRATWSRGALDDVHRQYSDLRSGGNRAVTHVVYLDGEYETAGVLGIAIGHDFVVIFSESIDDGCDNAAFGLPVCSTADRNTAHTAVLVHEFGHILGLVDNGVPMVNQHEASTCQGRADSGHSSNQNSVMFCAAETTGLFGLNSIPTTFDTNDKLDLCNAGGKGSC